MSSHYKLAFLKSTILIDLVIRVCAMFQFLRSKEKIHATNTALHLALPAPLFCLFLALLFTFTAVVADAQEYTSIVVFGDSLSDIGNVAHLTEAKYGVRIPGPMPTTPMAVSLTATAYEPAAQKYFGVWIEQLAATLPSKPEYHGLAQVESTDAYGFATTGSGTGVFTFGTSDSLSVNVNNIGLADYGLSRYASVDQR